MGSLFSDPNASAEQLTIPYSNHPNSAFVKPTPAASNNVPKFSIYVFKSPPRDPDRKPISLL